MENKLNLLEATTNKSVINADQANVFDNAISIEKLEERLEPLDTCVGLMAF